MFDKIVIPLPWGEAPATALHHGAALARQAGATLELVTVRAGGIEPGLARAHLVDLTQFHQVDAEVDVIDADDPAAALARIGSEPGTLLCLRTHARRPVSELALGSVSARVVRTCRRPVLLVGPRCGPAPDRYSTMVVALDGSPLATSILPVVARWSTHLDLTPWLFEVLPARVPLEVPDGDIDEASYVHRLADQLGAEGVRAAWDVAHGRDTATAISRFAGRQEGSLIALSTHGRSGLQHVTMGSVAMGVAHRATTPVLVYHPGDPARPEPTPSEYRPQNRS